MVAINTLFNSTGEVGSWITASQTNVTGSLFLSIILILAFFFLMMLLFKMDLLLMALIIAPLAIVFSTIGEVSQGMKLIVGAIILITALGLYAFYPSK